MLDIEEHLLDAVLSHRDEDCPRLIYADWLEETGDVRAEFIRLQCELASSPDRSTLKQKNRITHLDRSFRRRWLSSSDRPEYHLRFERGFAEYARLSAAHFAKSGREVLRNRMLRDLTITPTGQLAHGAPALVTNLNWTLGRAELDCLRISRCGMSQDDFLRLMRIQKLSRLRTLDLAWNQCVTNETLGSLENATFAGSLRMLDLTGCMMDGDAFDVIASKEFFKGLDLIVLHRPNARRYAKHRKRLDERLGQRILYM